MVIKNKIVYSKVDSKTWPVIIPVLFSLLRLRKPNVILWLMLLNTCDFQGKMPIFQF